MEEQPVHAPPADTPSTPPAPIMDVKAPGATSAAPAAAPPAAAKPATKLDKSAPPPKAPPKPKTKGVTAAITATVIIVLGLAALAVYAYINTK